MSTVQNGQALVHLPSGLPLDLVAALGQYVSAALPGAMLGPGTGLGVAAEVYAGDGVDTHETIERLRHATATVQGVEYQPAAPGDDADEMTLNRLALDDEGRMTVAVGGPKEVAEQAAKNLLASFIPFLDEQGAENYLQWEVLIPQRDDDGNRTGPDQRFAFIVVRPGKKTPHELRREAEAELAKLRGKRTRKTKAANS